MALPNHLLTHSSTLSGAHHVTTPSAFMPHTVQMPEIQINQSPISGERPTSRFGSRLHWALQHPGFDWVVNSSLSLLITFNLKPTQFGKLLLKGAEKIMLPVTSISRGISELRYKVISPDSARKLAESNGEILLMFIAGSLVVPAMRWMERIKTPFVGKANLWWDKLNGREPHQEDIDAAATPKAKEPWGKWIKARVAGMGAILLVNSGIERWNQAYPKSDIYQVSYSWAKKLFDRFPNWSAEFANKVTTNTYEKATEDNINAKAELVERFTTGDKKFFASKVSGTTNKVEEARVLFAEQVRIVWKEVALTFVMMGLVAMFANIFGKSDKTKEAPTAAEKTTAPAEANKMTGVQQSATPEQTHTTKKLEGSKAFHTLHKRERKDAVKETLQRPMQPNHLAGIQAEREQMAHASTYKRAS